MAVVIMAGYPYSGKTEFCKMVSAELDKRNMKCLHLTPSNYISDNYWSLESDLQKADMVSAWNKCSEELSKNMSNKNNTILFDTCGSNLESISKYVPLLKHNGHKVIYVFVAAHVNECRERAKDNWISNDTMIRYQNEFNKSVFTMKRLSDRFFFVKNINDVNKVNLKSNAIKVAEAINGEIGGIRKPKPIHSADNRPRQTNNKRPEIRKNRPV